MYSNVNESFTVKLGYCEKATKFKKKYPACFVLLSNVKTSGRIFQIFLAFSENLNFNNFLSFSSVRSDYEI